MMMVFVIWSIILGVKFDANFENDIRKRISPRLGVVLVGFNANGVVFWKFFIYFALVMSGISLGVKRHADYENTVTEWIS